MILSFFFDRLYLFFLIDFIFFSRYTKNDFLKCQVRYSPNVKNFAVLVGYLSVFWSFFCRFFVVFCGFFVIFLRFLLVFCQFFLDFFCQYRGCCQFFVIFCRFFVRHALSTA